MPVPDLIPSRRPTTTEFQGTLAAEVDFQGPGLHSGGTQRIVMRPAPAGHGVSFISGSRKSKGVSFPALWQRAKDSRLCTSLDMGRGARLRTIEHLMAACYACGVDNAEIEVLGREIPIMDGSAKPIVELIERAGVQPLNSPRRRIALRKTIQVRDRNRVLKAEPSPRFHLVVQTSTPGFGRMVWKGPMNRTVFKREIIAARTFGRLDHGLLAKFLTAFSKEPLCQGAGFRTAIVTSRTKVLNPGGLRFPDEFVRHRVLDLVGDLMLAGGDLIAKVTAKSPAHRINRLLLKAIFTDPEAWEEG